MKKRSSRRTNKYILLYLILAAGLIIFCVSKSSPLYPFNDWFDANCYFTVGKSFWKDLVVYKDLFEQKGPLLYFLHALAYLVSHDTFLGVYFLEVIAASFFAYFSYKIILLFSKKPLWVFIPLVMTIIYTSASFSHGDSAEEFCLPLLTYGLYLLLKNQKTNEPLTFIEALLLGLTSGMVLWIKFSLLGFYLGWIIIPVITYLKNKKYKELGTLFWGIVLGVIIITLPFFIYFLVNNALTDWFTVYFYDNIFIYHQSGSLINAFTKTISSNPWLWLLILAGLTSLFKDSKVLASTLLTLITLILLVYSGGRSYVYYGFIFALYAPLCLLILDYLPSINKLKIVSILILLVSVSLSYFLTPNAYLRNYSQEDLPQYKFAKIINEVPNATLLNYGFLDGGFYTTSNTFPSERFFCQLNIELPEMTESLNRAISEGRVDFIVSSHKLKNSSLYELVASEDFPYEKMTYSYYLYRKIGLTN